jgi:hypothetical protein
MALFKASMSKLRKIIVFNVCLIKPAEDFSFLLLEYGMNHFAKEVIF